jgi:glycosyltransferase involved in cell wall biosynthesis
MGWRVSLIAFGKPETRSVLGIEVICLPTQDYYFLRHLIFHLHLLAFLARRWSSIDFILFNQASAPFLLPLKMIRSILGNELPRLIMDTRTVLMEDIQHGTWRDRLRGQFYHVTGVLANRWADGQTAITQRMAMQVGIPPERLWGIWSSGVNLEFFSAGRANRHWPEKDDPIHVMYIGVVNYERNLLSLCQAVEWANLEGMKFTLTITGDGTEREELEKFAAESDGKIRIKRPIPHEKIPELLTMAHIGAIPFPDEQKFRISSPIKLFEYLASGLPILATRIACHTDVIGDDSYAFWAEDSTVEGLFNALKLAWEQKSKLRELGEQSTLAARQRSWSASAVNISKALLSHSNLPLQRNHSRVRG